MKKRWILLLAVLLLTSLVYTAVAEIKTVDLLEGKIYLTVGRAHTILPQYKDHSNQFEGNYTQADFNITYATAHEGVTIDADGTLHISEEAPAGTINIDVTYALKKRPSLTRKNIDRNVILVEAPTRMELGTERLVLPVGSSMRSVRIAYPYGKQILESYSYDDEMLQVTVESSNYSPYNKYVNIEPLAVGESDITLRSMNELVKKLKVIVVERASKVELAVDHVVCTVGDVIDLGVDLGNGPDGVEGLEPGMEVRENGKWLHTNPIDFRTKDCHFNAWRGGLFDVTVASGQYSDSVRIEVYDDAACQDIELSLGVAAVNVAEKVTLRDQDGNVIFRPVVVTGDAEAYAEGGYWYVTPKAEGEFTVTVKNPDGSTYAETFEVRPKRPTSIEISAIYVTMQIGEVFDLNPKLNVEGDFVCEYQVDPLNSANDYGVVCVRVEDGKIIAQGPGSGRVYVTCGDANATCYVTVEESDAQLELVYSEYPLGAGRTVQVSVQDQTGKVYPATFEMSWASNDRVTITPDGQLTAVSGSAGFSYRFEAQLEDGRVITSQSQNVVVYPKWIEYSNVFLTMGNEVMASSIRTDQGLIDWDEVILTIEDTNIAYKSVNDFWPQNPGITNATITSKYSGVSCTFQIEVVDERLYIGSTTMHVPYGFIAQLPVVTNASGKEISVKWNIIQNNPGEGNPEASAFQLEDKAIACIWPEGSCILTGTASNGSTVRVNVYAYYLPEAIDVTPYVINLNIGENQSMKVAWDDPYAQIKTVYWIADVEGIIDYSEYTTPTDQRITGKAAGTTYLMALLSNGVYGICQVNVTNPYARLPGDANEDGVVDAQDALRVMQYVAGWNLSINGYAADVNADGKVTVDDAGLIFEYDAGLNVQLKQYIPGS